MKKVFLLLTLIAATVGAWGVTVSKTVEQIKNAQSTSWSSGTDYSSIVFDNVITISRGKYYLENSTHKLRSYYQPGWSASKFSLSAQTGAIIKSVKFTYKGDDNSILTNTYHYDETNIPSSHIVSSGTAFTVNANSQMFYVSKTTGGKTQSNLNITAIEVTYLIQPELKFAETSKTVCKNAAAFINPLQNKGNGTVSYDSSDKNVATVANNGTITVKGVGSTTITATSTETSAYLSGTATYTLTVTDNLTPSPLAPVDITETKPVKSITQDYGWTTEEPHTSFAYNGALTLGASSGNGKNVSSNGYLRYYQNSNKGELKLTAKQRAVIKSAKFTYTETSNQTLTKYYGSKGQNIPTEYRVTSNSTYVANANAFSLYTGSTADVTGKSVDVGTFSIVYTDPTIVFERLQSYSSGTANVDGDNKLYKWTVTAQNHTEDVGAYKGIKLEGTNSIAMTNSPEGGIKSVSFDYKVLSTSAIGLNVSAGSTIHNFTHNAADASGRIFTYTHDFSKAENAALTIAMVSGKSAVAVGPIHITPYLLFNVANHAATFNVEDGTKCDLNSALINNTGENTHTFSILKNTAGGNPTISDAGILDFSSVVRTGTIKVQAAWGSVTTTLTLTINLKDPQVYFKDTLVTEKVKVGYSTQELTIPTDGVRSYKIISGPDGASVDSTGKVTFSAAGDYIIRGKMDAKLPYGEDSAQYKLRVTALNVPALSFVADSVEQPISAGTYQNELTTSVGVGDTTYTSLNVDVATVDTATGLVTLVAAGTTNIIAYVAENDSFAAGQKSYYLKVYAMPVMSFADGDKNVYLNQEPFTYAVTKTAGDGEITYESGDENVAEVNNDGKVTIKGAGTTTITANIAKGATYWSGSASYTLAVSTLKLPTASFTKSEVNMNQNDDPVTIAVNTESNGKRHYSSSDTRVATVNDSTGEVTMGEKPGTTIISVSLDASDTWAALDNAAQYTLNVSAAKVADLHLITKTVAQMRGTAEWAGGSQHPNIDIVEGIVLSDGKYYSNIDGEHFRYYYNADPKYVSSTTFTIQAKAGVIIQTVKINYIQGNDKMVLADANYNGAEVPSVNRIISGTTYKVDANSVTYYVGRTGTLPSANNFVNVTGYEIKYFDPSTGVAVTKTGGDLGKDLGLKQDTCYQNIAFNQAITIHAEAKNTMRYQDAGQLNCYRHTGSIDFIARPGATIHYIKITYSGNNVMLTKYHGNQGFEIPEIDRIASDSVLYVNANSLKLWVGTTQSSGYQTLGIKKIYVNYTDSSIVTVDNFNNCESKGIGAGGTVNVTGVDGKYDWTISNFARDNAQRMYYDQSIKLNKGGKISTQYTGGLKEVAFDWHPSEKDKAVKFTVKAGGETYVVEKAAVDTIRPYTFNFQKTAIKSNGEFSIAVDNASGTTVEIGHISLTPYLLYANAQEEIDAKNYKDADWKYTIANTLTNYTGKDVAYSIINGEGIASIEDPTKAEVTILGGGTVTVKATADGATASYQLKINLEETSAKFDEHNVNQVGAGSYKQELTITTEATEGNVVTYSFIGGHEGADINSSTGEVTYTQAGQFKIKGELAQNMPYAAAADTFTLTVTIKEIPHISYAVTAVSRKVEEGVFTNPLTSKAGVGDTTYVSTDQVVATVDAKGEVTPLKPGVTIIKAIVAESEDYTADTAYYTLNVLGKPVPGVETVNGNIAAIAVRDNWEDNKYYSYFKLDDVISVSDSNRLHLNSQYLEEDECVRFYQNQTKGEFFIRAKAGAIIQAVQFTYTSENDGVITNNYGTDGKSIAAANQYLSGVTYKFDANKLVFYTGSTTDKTNGEVHITGIAVKYFDPDKGVEVTKNVSDLAKQNGLKTNTAYQDVAVNNVIKLHADKTGTLKYYSPNQFNCYNHCGAIDIIAREGATINYVKVTYANGDGVLTENVDGGLNLSPAQYIASDSIMEVNNDTLRLYIGSKGDSYQTLAISKFYVNYTDSKSIVDNFDNCTKIYGGATATEVMGVDSTFKWEFTQFNRDSLRRIGYDQSTMLRQAGGKIAANNVDGGIKEVSFDWFASNSNQGVKFNVKAGGQTITVDSAAAGGYYPITYTLTDIKTNGAFSIEMDPTSGSQMEVGHISLTPYLFYKEKEVNVKVGGTYKNESLVDYRDSEEDITYSSSKDSVATVEADGTVTAQHVGTATITASWNGVATSYTINVQGDKTAIVLKRNDNTENADTLINNYGETMPEFTLPTREGWRFNAYFPDASASKPSERITVTAWDEKTYYVANVKHSNITMTDKDRNWVYDRPTYTLYAQWMPELTIVLDNQDATTPGTPQVITAHCPNNASVNLSQKIEIPAKDGYTFLGYFTADSVQLIEANGAFIANVPNYTNETRMWQKDEGTTLYAHWEMVAITLNEALNNDSVINSHDGEVVGQVDLVRTLAAGKYNTFCLPFDITKADLATALNTEIVSLATLDENSEARLTESKLYILAKELEDDSVMHAGKPYLLQIAEEVKDPSFSFVKIGKANDSIESLDGSVKFYGITSPFKVPVDNQYLFMSNNMLNWNNTGTATDMKGLRAYFHVKGLTNPSQVSARLVFRMPTDLEDVNANVNEVRKMVIDNQLIIIRDGVKFNAMGAKL